MIRLAMLLICLHSLSVSWLIRWSLERQNHEGKNYKSLVEGLQMADATSLHRGKRHVGFPWCLVWLFGMQRSLRPFSKAHMHNQNGLTKVKYKKLKFDSPLNVKPANKKRQSCFPDQSGDRYCTSVTPPCGVRQYTRAHPDYSNTTPSADSPLYSLPFLDCWFTDGLLLLGGWCELPRAAGWL